MRSSHGEGLERDYELRSRGPATLGVEALDRCVPFFREHARASIGMHSIDELIRVQHQLHLDSIVCLVNLLMMKQMVVSCSYIIL